MGISQHTYIIARVSVHSINFLSSRLDEVKLCVAECEGRPCEKGERRNYLKKHMGRYVKGLIIVTHRNLTHDISIEW